MGDGNNRWKLQLRYFLLGVGSVCAILFLTGSVEYSHSTLNFGRYQLSSWATQVNNNSGVIGAFVMDTVSGETKTVYIRTYGQPGKSSVIKNDLKKAFSAVE